MRAMLVQQGLTEALKGAASLPSTFSDEEKNHLMEKAQSSLLLSLGDKALKEVSREKTAQGVMLKLDKMQMSKSLANRLYLNQRLYSFMMNEEKLVSEQID